ncbi:hypothetical protein GCM10023152_24790 [Agromyces bauzanensis]|uniref:Uncharacterized protein n=1 Tax=Agromyces bauzanensis TaxID=1308924 RepID=A0A917PN14_9MICO|nr:hypothetical protein GCM10011372_24260 [Agromyces bauzanensis]
MRRQRLAIIDAYQAIIEQLTARVVEVTADLGADHAHRPLRIPPLQSSTLGGPMREYRMWVPG